LQLAAGLGMMGIHGNVIAPNNAVNAA